MKLLLIEDNILLKDNITFFLKEENFTVDTADDGETGNNKALKNSYDIIILDLMLPKMDGASIVKSLKSNNILTPILVLSSKAQIEDKVALFNLGCDDYLTKPFASAELLVRIHSLLRRTHNISSPLIKIADMEINTSNKQVVRSGRNIELTSKEYMILEYFAYNKNKVITKAELAEHIWGKDIGLLTMVNSLDFHIQNLRKKIDYGFRHKILNTKRGFGFILIDKHG